MINAKFFQDREKGRSAYIIGNGPSIRTHNLSLLMGRVVIGMNASPLLERQHGFRAQYYTLSDRRFLVDSGKRPICCGDLPPYSYRILRGDLDVDDDQSAEIQGRTCYVRPLGRDGFSRNLRRGFYFGSTTTMLAIQLAYYMGCQDIYLLGVDMRYSDESPRFYSEEVPQMPDNLISVQLKNIADAYRELKREGRHLMCCTESSFLRAYLPFMDYERSVNGG